MIRIADPTQLGPALADLRAITGWSRRRLARAIAEKTGRSETSVNSQLWGWDNAIHQPDLASVPIVLDALGYDLALIPREDTPPSPPSATGDTEQPPPGGSGHPKAAETLCGHCGGPPRDYGSAVDGTRLCHPDTGMDCYTLVTGYGHTMPCHSLAADRSYFAAVDELITDTEEQP